MNFQFSILSKWTGVFIWMAVIFYFSDQPDLKSGLPGEWDFIFRKLAHIAEYFILTWLLVLALAGGKITKRRAFIFAGSIALFYAASDEVHQLFVAGRAGAVKDVIIDGIGILAALYAKNNLILFGL